MIHGGCIGKDHGAEDEETQQETSESSHYKRFRMKKKGWLSKSSRRRGAACESGSEKSPAGSSIGKHTCSWKNGCGLCKIELYQSGKCCDLEARVPMYRRMRQLVQDKTRGNNWRPKKRPCGAVNFRSTHAISPIVAAPTGASPGSEA